MPKYTVRGNQKLSPSTQLLTLVPNANSKPLDFEPGQYAAISFKRRGRPTAVRCFSIASSPAEQSSLQFSMRVKGRYTKAIRTLAEGDQVKIRGPFGGFVFDPDWADSFVLFAGGIGIAPYISMIRYATKLKLKTKLHLVYSNQSQDDIPFFEELQNLQRTNPNLSVSYIIGAGDTNRLANYKVYSGRLDARMLSALGVNPEYQLFYLCGPPGYMRSVHTLLLRAGAPPENILSEAFSQSTKNQTGTIKSWPFNIYALSAMAVLVGGIGIMAIDLSKTLPKIKSQVAAQPQSNVIKRGETNTDKAVNSVSPQIDTNINQTPSSSSSSGSSSSSNSSSGSGGYYYYTPAPTQTTTPAPSARSSLS